MINEYLFLSDEYQSKVKEYKPDGITVEISGISNTPLWVASYSLAHKNEESAKKLSEVNMYLMQYSPLVLSCESSEYYNQILFPMVNKLERKLRKLLYLAASISDNEKAKESIKQIEEMDFGEIFDLLFIDQNFILDMKKRINAETKSEFSGKSKYSKEEIKAYLDSLVEHSLWDKILGEKDVPTLRSRFRDVQFYRNDVMHAHNINKELFNNSRNLFEKINKELDISIGKLIGVSDEKHTKQKTEVNTAISSAMAAMDLSTVTDVLKGASVLIAMLEMSKVVKDLQPLNTTLDDATKRILQPEISPVTAEALKKINTLQTSPAMERYNRQMSQLSEVMHQEQQKLNVLKPNNSLKESLRSITYGMSHNNDGLDDFDNKDYETDKEDEPKEDTSNE
ncbi:MAG: hypothetical protein QM689_12470 [Oscillospiraceae bacterium]